MIHRCLKKTSRASNKFGDPDEIESLWVSTCTHLFLRVYGMTLLLVRKVVGVSRGAKQHQPCSESFA